MPRLRCGAYQGLNVGAAPLSSDHRVFRIGKYTASGYALRNAMSAADNCCVNHSINGVFVPAVFELVLKALKGFGIYT